MHRFSCRRKYSTDIRIFIYSVPPPSEIGADHPPLDETALSFRITQHEATIRELFKEIAQRRQAVSFYKGSMNVIRPRINAILPSEVLAEIFYEHIHALLFYETDVLDWPYDTFPRS